jgi:hypothetical protein
MKKVLGSLGVVVLGLSLGFAQGSAQSPSAADQNSAGAPAVGPNMDTNRDHHDWGWIGLIGLAGLAGLGGRKRETTRRDRGDATDIRRVA